jgi:hypothetical protein
MAETDDRNPQSRRRGSLTLMGSVLRTALKQGGFTRTLSRHAVVEMWPKVVSPTIARHARCEKVSDTTVYVIVDSSAWMHELSALKNVLLEKINATLEADAQPFTEIRFQQRSWAAERPEPASQEPPPKLTDEDHHLIRSIVESIQDEQLKKSFRRLLEKDLLLKRSRGGDKGKE